MRTFVIAAAGLLVCTPAFAQTAAGPQSQPESQMTSPSAQSQPDSQTTSPQAQSEPESTAAAPQAQTPQMAVKIANQIKSHLEQAGFKNIQLVPRAFLVSAQDQDDNPIVMVVNPNSITWMSKTRQPPGESGTVGQGTGAPANPDNSNGAEQPR